MYIKRANIDYGFEGETMTNNIHELRFDSILPDLKVTSAKQVLQKLAKHAFRLIGTPEKILLNNLLLQEQNETSGIGQGVAIVHMRLPRLTKPFVVFTKLARMVDFKAIDEEPVDLVCLVLSPEYEGPKHLRRLAKVSRFFNDKRFCDNLRAAQNTDDIRMVLKEINSRKMAA